MGLPEMLIGSHMGIQSSADTALTHQQSDNNYDMDVNCPYSIILARLSMGGAVPIHIRTLLACNCLANRNVLLSPQSCLLQTPKNVIATIAGWERAITLQSMFWIVGRHRKWT